MTSSDSRGLFRGLVEFPWPPHVLVLSYFGNDLHEAAEELGFVPPAHVPYGDLPAPVRAVVQRSYFLDYLYWSWPRGELFGWWGFFQRAWGDPRVVALHERDLEKFVQYSRDRKVPMVVVLFPFLHDAETSALYVPRVKAFFEARGVRVIDASTLVADLPVSERIATVNDVHPSPLVHARVADALAKELPELIAAEAR